MSNEQERHEELENILGGARKAFRLLEIHTCAVQSASGNQFTLRKMPSAEERFRSAAAMAGYTKKQIDAFLALN